MYTHYYSPIDRLNLTEAYNYDVYRLKLLVKSSTPHLTGDHTRKSNFKATNIKFIFPNSAVRKSQMSQNFKFIYLVY